MNVSNSDLEPGSIVYLSDGKPFNQSSAVLRILIRLGGAWQLMAIFFIVPPFIRNAVYRYVANNRYRWYGKKESCRMPTTEEREYFLP